MKKFISDTDNDDTTVSSKYNGPKFDAHVHLGSMKGINNLIKYREEFNIKKSVGIKRQTIRNSGKKITSRGRY